MAKEENILSPEGIYNPLLKFSFTNITEVPFEIKWNGEIVTVLKGGETVELPHYLAVVATKNLVDSIMIGNAKLDEITYYKNNPNTQPNMYRASSALGVPAARKVWEDQICRLMEVDEESPQVQVMRATIKAELMADLGAQPSQGSPLENAPKSLSEFADLTAPKTDETPKQSKIKVKKVKTPK
jgi:hypothetical protein